MTYKKDAYQRSLVHFTIQPSIEHGIFMNIDEACQMHHTKNLYDVTLALSKK